jgi:hypothetical protein
LAQSQAAKKISLIVSGAGLGREDLADVLSGIFAQLLPDSPPPVLDITWCALGEPSREVPLVVWVTTALAWSTELVQTVWTDATTMLGKFADAVVVKDRAGAAVYRTQLRPQTKPGVFSVATPVFGPAFAGVTSL